MKDFTPQIYKEIIEKNVRLAKTTQKLNDINRVERKSFREHARIENAVESLNIELIKILKEKNLSKLTKKIINGEQKSLKIKILLI